MDRGPVAKRMFCNWPFSVFKISAHHGRVAVNVELLLAGHPFLFFGRKLGIESGDGGVVLTAVCGGAGDVHPVFALQRAGDQFGHQQGGGEIAGDNEADIFLLTADKTAADIVAGVAEVDVHIVTHPAGRLEGMFDEHLAQLLPLEFRGNAERAKGEDLFALAVLVLQPGFGIHNIADDPAIQFQHEGQVGDKVGVGAHHVDEVMLVRAGLVDIPEGLPGQLLHSPVVGWGLIADDDIHGSSPWGCDCVTIIPKNKGGCK